MRVPEIIPNATLDIVRVPMFSDNYGWIIRDKSTGKVAAVDPAEPNAIQTVLAKRCARTIQYHSVSSPGY
jgi:hypothetical protein